MATLTRTKTWAAGEKLAYTDANTEWNALFTFFSASGSVSHNDGSQAFSADVPGPYSLATQDAQAIRKRQADYSPELIGTSTTCWLHAGAHAAPALGVPYIIAGDAIVLGDAFGQYDLALPQTFPTDILTFVAFTGDVPVLVSSTRIHAKAANSSTSAIRIVQDVPALKRFCYIAVGW